MRYGSVKHIALYYKAIPGMLRLLRQERAELEGNYYGLRGLACDGMPRGSSPGKPTEESGLRALENGVRSRRRSGFCPGMKPVFAPVWTR